MLRWRLMQHSASELGRLRSGALEDEYTTGAIQSIKRIMEAMRDAQARLFSVTLLLRLHESTSEGLAEQLMLEVDDFLGSLLAEYDDLPGRHDAGFAQATLTPRRILSHPRTFDTTGLAYSWPGCGQGVSDGSGLYLGYDVQEGDLIFIDILNRSLHENGHGVIIGPSGNGKTTAFIKFISEALTAYDPAPFVFLLDPKGDYRKQREFFDAEVISLAAGQQDDAPAISIMDLPKARAVKGVAARNPVIAQTAVVVDFLNMAARGLAAEELGVLDQAILETYRRADILAYRQTGDGRQEPAWDTWHLPAPPLSKVAAVLTEWGAKNALAAGLALKIHRATSGSLASVFSRPTNINPTKRFVVFDLEEIAEEDKALATYLCSCYMWSFCRAHEDQYVIGLEEIGEGLHEPAMARLAGQIWTLGRSYGVCAWGMTQKMVDLSGTTDREAVLDNSATVILLKQAGGPNMARVIDRWPLLTQTNREFLRSAERGQGVILVRGAQAQIQIDPCELEFSLLPQSSVITQAQQVVATMPESVDA
jgi:hypothetical protein